MSEIYLNIFQYWKGQKAKHCLLFKLNQKIMFKLLLLLMIICATQSLTLILLNNKEMHLVSTPFGLYDVHILSSKCVHMLSHVPKRTFLQRPYSLHYFNNDLHALQWEYICIHDDPYTYYYVLQYQLWYIFLNYLFIECLANWNSLAWPGWTYVKK